MNKKFSLRLRTFNLNTTEITNSNGPKITNLKKKSCAEIKKIQFWAFRSLRMAKFTPASRRSDELCLWANSLPEKVQFESIGDRMPNMHYSHWVFLECHFVFDICSQTATSKLILRKKKCLFIKINFYYCLRSPYFPQLPSNMTICLFIKPMLQNKCLSKQNRKAFEKFFKLWMLKYQTSMMNKNYHFFTTWRL